MKAFNIVVLITLFFSCNTKNESIVDKNLTSIYTYSYDITPDNVKLTVFTEKGYENGTELYISNQLTKEKFDSKGNLIEQLDYEIESGDTTVTRFINNRYNQRHELIGEYDSNSLFVMKSINTFSDNKRIKDSTVRVLITRDIVGNEYKTISIDSTITNTIRHFIDTIVVSTTSIEWDLKMRDLVENYSPDTTYSYLEYDDFGNNIKDISVSKGDTIFASISEYDNKNRLQGHVTVDNYLQLTKMTNTYDEQGNLIIEIYQTDDFNIKKENEYDDQNRIIESRRYSLD